MRWTTIKYIIILCLLLTLASVLFACAPARKTITFDSNGGSEVEASNIKGRHVINLPSPERDGYIFDGWYYDKDLWKNQLTTTTYSKKRLKENVTVYAKWTFFGYYVTFDTDGGSEVEAQLMEEDGRIMSPPFTEKQGFSFLGWCIDNTRTIFYQFGMPINSSMVLYAKWLSNENLQYFTINFVTNGGTEVDSIQALEGQGVSLPVSAKVGYIFKGWYVNESLTLLYPTSNIVTSSFTLYAKWEESPYLFTISFNSNGGNLIADIRVMVSELFSMPLPQREGYIFKGWFVDQDLTQPYDFQNGAYSSVTLYAKWEERQLESAYYTASYYSEGALLRTLTLDANSVVPFSAEERQGWIFEGWYAENDFLSQYNFSAPITQNTMLYAKWRENTDILHEGLTYSLSQDGAYYSIIEFNGLATSIIIPETYNQLPIKAIESKVFENSGITSVIFSENLISIGISSFENCNELTEIIIPSNITEISSRAFARCDKLAAITIEGSPQLGNYIFDSCAALINVNLSDDILRIAPHMFINCMALQSISIPENCEEIAEGAFSGCFSLGTVELSESVKTIGVQAFSGCFSLSEIDLASVETILSRAFAKSGITNLILTDSVISFGSGAFSECSKLKTVNIGSGLVTMENSFTQSYGIESFEVSAQSSVFASFNNTLYSKNLSSLIQYPPNSNQIEFEIPAGTENIAGFAFAGAKFLQQLALPSSLQAIDESAFLEMSAMQSFYVNPSSSYYYAENGTLYNKDISIIVKYPINRNETVFTVPLTVTTMSPFAFMGAKSLMEITLPPSLQKISDYAFYEAKKLNKVIFPSGGVITEIGSYAFYGCDELRNIALAPSITKLKRYSFSSSGITSIVIPGNITEIGYRAFADNASLSKVSIGAGMNDISNNIFNNCSYLTEVVFFGSPQYITDAFESCDNIEKVTISGDTRITDISQTSFSSNPELFVHQDMLYDYQQQYQAFTIFSNISLI